MSETTIIERTAVLDQYVDFWNAETAGEQRRLAAAVFGAPMSYHAPVGILTGPDELINFRNQFTEHMGAARLEVRREPETHHDRARLLWEIRLPGGEPFATGTDVIAFTDDGRIAEVTSFLDRAPEGFERGHHE